MGKKPQKFQLEWYCANCWQEGVVEIAALSKPEDFAEVAEIRREHASMVRAFKGKCAGKIAEQKKQVLHRVHHEKSPELPDVGGFKLA